MDKQTEQHSSVNLAAESQKGNPRFLRVVIAAAVALIVILLAAVVLVGGKGKKLLPKDKTPHATSQVVMYRSPLAA